MSDDVLSFNALSLMVQKTSKYNASGILTGEKE